MIWFTADLHLGHERILGLGPGRPFVTIAEHDRAIIDGINDAVGPQDQLWVLGDVGIGLKTDGYRAVRSRILCRHVHLVVGNHDHEARAVASQAFESVQAYSRLGRPSRDGWRAVLCHYLILDWDGMYDGAYMLHGHMHSRPVGTRGAANPALLGTTHVHAVAGYNELMRRRGTRRYDVGVDANGYRPVSLAEVLSFFGDREAAARIEAGEGLA